MMKILVPNYYHKFRCIAEKCQHSCCAGWEIDIDPKSVKTYRTMQGEMGEKIRQKMVDDGEGVHFILDADDRCPFLLQNGLCDLICNLGEGVLCDICRDHPRFRNFYADFIEIGLGLCCEAVAAILLEEQEPFDIVPLSDTEEIFLSEEEEAFFAWRNKLFAIVQNRDIPLGKRIEALSVYGECHLEEWNLNDLCDRYLSLERLDEKWTQALEGIKDKTFSFSMMDDEKFALPIEQLLCYFLYRHLTDAVWSGEHASGVRFSIQSCYIIAALWHYHMEITKEEMVNYARMYSAEVEYSEENLKQMMG